MLPGNAPLEELQPLHLLVRFDELDHWVDTPQVFEPRDLLGRETVPHEIVAPGFFRIRQERENVIRETKVREAPDMIAEMLSPSTPEHDTRVKRYAYARAGVLEYWIVRPATRDVLVCWNQDAVLSDYTQTRLVGPDDELEAATLPIQVSVHELFSGAPDSTL